MGLGGYLTWTATAKEIRKKLARKIKAYGRKSKDLLESVDFILERKF